MAELNTNVIYPVGNDLTTAEVAFDYNGYSDTVAVSVVPDVSAVDLSDPSTYQNIEFTFSGSNTTSFYNYPVTVEVSGWFSTDGNYGIEGKVSIEWDK